MVEVVDEAFRAVVDVPDEETIEDDVVVTQIVEVEEGTVVVELVDDVVVELVELVELVDEGIVDDVELVDDGTVDDVELVEPDVANEIAVDAVG